MEGDPGELLEAADAIARAAPDGDLGVMPTEELERVCAEARAAALGLRAILALIPFGATRVPEAALRTARARAVYERDPSRFERARLQADLAPHERRWYTAARLLGERAAPEFHARTAQLAHDLLDALDAPADPTTVEQTEEPAQGQTEDAAQATRAAPAARTTDDASRGRE
jgi:hypothetical protein